MPPVGPTNLCEILRAYTRVKCVLLVIYSESRGRVNAIDAKNGRKASKPGAMGPRFEGGDSVQAHFLESGSISLRKSITSSSLSSISSSSEVSADVTVGGLGALETGGLRGAGGRVVESSASIS